MVLIFEDIKGGTIFTKRNNLVRVDCFINIFMRKKKFFHIQNSSYN